MTATASVKVVRPAPSYSVATTPAVSEDLSIVLTNQQAFATRAEFLAAVEAAGNHIANTLGLK